MKKEEITFKRTKKETTENKKITNILKLLFLLLKQDNQGAEYYSEQLNCKVPTVKKYIKAIRASYDASEHTGFEISYNHSEKNTNSFLT